MTILTQIGGIVYVVSVLLLKKYTNKSYLKRIAVFVSLYLLATFLLTPIIAPLFGREPVKESEYIQAHTFLTKMFNRNYVKPKLNSILKQTAFALNKKHKGIKLIYLDANFPFIDKFPLLPHLSHNDGKKIDLSLIYKDNKGILTNKKPSVSGYGSYVKPVNKEKSKATKCKNKGYWQYDFPKYMTLGKTNTEISFSKEATQFLVNQLVSYNSIQKVFIEPHLKKSMGLVHAKIRFHGCQAVRHDDHLHIQIK